MRARSAKFAKFKLRVREAERDRHIPTRGYAHLGVCVERVKDLLR